jgi:hypothetical protein
MILRRLSQHIKDQNWFAVVLDFVIVVFGVFFGIQIGNWNDTRLDHEAYQQAHDRMVIEARNNIDTIEKSLAIALPFSEKVYSAIEDIRACRNDEQAKERIHEAIDIIKVTFTPSVQNIAISQLTSSERLLETQSAERREQYTRYAQYLNSRNIWSRIMIEKMASRSDTLHPFIDYGPLKSTDNINEVHSNRSRVLVVGMDEACKDDEFRKLFYLWEAGNSYQVNLMTEIVLKTKAYLQELGEEKKSEKPI